MKEQITHPTKLRQDMHTNKDFKHQNSRCLGPSAKPNTNNQDNMPPPGASNPIARGPKKNNLALSTRQGLKIVIMNMFKDLKEDTNK